MSGVHPGPEVRSLALILAGLLGAAAEAAGPAGRRPREAQGPARRRLGPKGSEARPGPGPATIGPASTWAGRSPT